MKTKLWVFIGGFACLGLLFVLLLSHFMKQTNPSRWQTLAGLTNAAGGYCFVREGHFGKFSFCDIGFGCIDASGTQYSYYLDHDTFPWRRVSLVETNGIICVIRNNSEQIASFDPASGVFHHYILSTTNNREAGLSHSYPPKFFMLTN